MSKKERLDLSGYECPLPLLKTKLYLKDLEPGDQVEVISTDPGSTVDFKVFAQQQQHGLDILEDGQRFVFLLTKSGSDEVTKAALEQCLSAVVIVSGSPVGAQAGYSAWQFCRAWLKAGHQIGCVFFHLDGIYHAIGWEPYAANSLRWSRLAAESMISLYFCTTSLMQRMAVESNDASFNAVIVPGFKPAGWGSLVELMQTSDRTLSFGG